MDLDYDYLNSARIINYHGLISYRLIDKDYAILDYLYYLMINILFHIL